MNRFCENNIIKNLKKAKMIIISPLEMVVNRKKYLAINEVSILRQSRQAALISIKNKVMEFYLSNETILRSKFKFLKNTDLINLELPLKYGQKISGHICQGHVDTVGKVLSINKIDKSYLFDFEMSSKEKKNIIEKASICINGISLTISKVTKKGFQIWVIPHTFKLTNLSKLKKGSLVNIEIDILSKYVKNFFNEKK